MVEQVILLLKAIFLLLPVRKVELLLVLLSFFNDKEPYLPLKVLLTLPFPAFSVQSVSLFCTLALNSQC